MLGCFLQTKEPLALVTNMDSYFQVTPPDCSLYSQDKFEFPVHKEVLYQTKVMCDMIKSTNVKDYSIDYLKIEIICPSLAKTPLIQLSFPVNLSPIKEISSVSTSIFITWLWLPGIP